MSVQTDSWPYRQIHNRTDGLNKVQTAKRMDSALFRIKRPDSRSYRGTRNRKKGLRIKWKDLYGRTQKRTDGLGIVRTDSELYGRTRIGIVRTDLESYGRTRNCADGLGIVRTDLESCGRTRNLTDGLGIVRTDSELYGRTRNRTDGLGIIRTDSES